MGALAVAPGLARLRFALAEAHFMAGEYGAAIDLYRSIGPDPRATEAEKMIDWIDYQSGNIERGWPHYPVARFSAEGPLSLSPGDSPITVGNFNRPVELVHELGLSSWQPEAVGGEPVLVWFNFHNSLGGELLAAKVVRAFQRQRAIDLVLAVDDCLRAMAAANFPGTTILTKSGDLRPLAGRCGSFLLARDALAHVVRSEQDFQTVARETFHVVPVRDPGPAPRRRRLAIAWNTTNRQQGRYWNLPLRDLAALLERLDLDYASAQHATTEEERAYLRRGLVERVSFDAIDPSADVQTLAAQIAATGCVLTIDNSVLDIDGTFGVPTLALLSVPSYWAWPMSGRSSRWHASVIPLHQARPGAWREVLGKAGDLLSRWRGGHFA